MRRLIVTSLSLAMIAAVLPSSATAQDGSFIEGLFRTITAAKAAKEREQQAERERELRQRREKSVKPNPQDVRVPTSIFPPGPGGQAPSFGPSRVSPRQTKTLPPRQPTEARRPTSPRDQRRSDPRSIRVQSQAAADFVNGLVSLATSADAMVEAIRATPNPSPSLRAQLPDAYRLVADCQALLDRCDGLSDVTTLRDEYADIDARWRKLSFELRAIDSLGGQVRDPLRQCDRTCSSIAKQLGIQPQFDRRALRDVMITAATHLQTLEDDLTLCRLPRSRVDSLTSSCRLLRQRLVQEAERVDRASYEETVTRFTEYVGRFGNFASAIATIDDPHVQRRMDRIAQCGTDTYALLWMTPPEPTIDMTHAAGHLLQSVDTLLNQMNFGTMIGMPQNEQIEVLNLGRSLRAGAEHFKQVAAQGVGRGELVTCLSEVDRAWSSMRPRIAALRTISPAVISAVDRDLSQIQSSLGGRGANLQASLNELVELAAALEGSSEYLEADLKRYERYLQPASYRSAMMRAAGDFHDESRRLHEQLSRGDDIRSLQKRTDRMIDAWKQLSEGISDIQQHGLTSSRARRLQQAQQELLPIVARVAAALSTR